MSKSRTEIDKEIMYRKIMPSASKEMQRRRRQIQEIQAQGNQIPRLLTA